MSYAIVSTKNLFFFFLPLFAPYLCLAVSNDSDISFVPLDFEEIKNKLFDNNDDFVNPSQFKYNLDHLDNHPQYDSEKCMEELAVIGLSLKNSELWAIKRNLNFRTKC